MPVLSSQSWHFVAKDCSSFLGIDIPAEEQAEALRRMGLDSICEDDTVYVEVPSTRLDIMHVKDLYEDVAKGYGYEKFGNGGIGVSQTTGGLMPITAISEQLRDVMVGLGFTEVTTLTLSNDRDEFEISGLPKLDNVRVLNPITEDHTCLRS